MSINFDEVDRLVKEGYISKRESPYAPGLFILNYTAKTQYSWEWTSETKACRGLIVDSQNNIIARPFEKFFSYEQLNGQVPNEPFEVWDKKDGSLIIVAVNPNNNRTIFASRGSFDSDQAKWAVELYANNSQYAHVFEPGLTYLFELIHPLNRIVVDYGQRKELILLAIIETATGKELPLVDIGFPLPQRYDGLNDLDTILKWQEPNKEGFVLRFASGQRVKIKLDEYKRLHRLLTGVSAKTIWDLLSKNQSLDDILEVVPDEFYTWVQSVVGKLHEHFADIERSCQAVFRNDFASRREAADYFKRQQFPHVLFQMLDNHDYAPAIWKIIRPEGSRAFRCDEEG